MPLSSLYERLRSSLWVVPAALAVASILLSQGAVWIDDWIVREGIKFRYLYPGGVEGARTVLGALAGSMMSLTTISFSVMMVVLTLASNQFGPRVLRNFLSDRFNQVTLGFFVATFLYCLLVLGRVPEPEEQARVAPRLAVSIALILTTVSLGLLIGFIHHVARSIQASEVVLRAHLEERRTIHSLYPADRGQDLETGYKTPLALPGGFSDRATEVFATSSGHVQAISADDIVAFARRHDALVKLHVRPGAFVTWGDRLAQVWCYPNGNSRTLPDVEKLVSAWIILGADRTGEQDAQYGLRQLTEIAIRGLSPGINDPNTAVSCINYIGDNLVLLARRTIPSPQRVDDDGVLRAELPRDGFVEIASEAFESLRHYGRHHPDVMRRLVDMLEIVSPHLRRAEDRAWVREALTAMTEEAGHLVARRDRGELRQHCRAVHRALHSASRTGPTTSDDHRTTRS